MMDPTDPDSFDHRTEKLATGRIYHFVDQIPSFTTHRTRTLLCVHGFPDLWYGWRHQIGPWVRAGHRVVVPDMLGYGGTDKPSNAAAYSPKKLCEDLVGLLDLLGIQHAVVLGHDWGALIAWRFALYFPERVQALVTFSVPFTPPTPAYISPEEAARRIPNFSYRVFFADEQSTKYVESNLEVFLSILFSRKIGDGFVRDTQKVLETVRNAPQMAFNSRLLQEKEYDYYLKQFSAGGMLGPLSYYRASKVQFEEERDSKLPSHMSTNFPVLFMWGTRDPTCLPRQVEKSQVFVKTQKAVKLEGASHWVLLQAKEEVVKEVLCLLQSLPLDAGLIAKL